jgi:NHL repeat
MGVITRVAGTTGASGGGGDDGPATHAQLDTPFGVAATADGGFLIADAGNHVVRRVAADGVISRVAGTTGISGSSGDGGPATDAQLFFPFSVAVTSDGGFLIADAGNDVVRKVSAAGVITRVAGITGAVGSTGDDGLATDAELNIPTAVAVTDDGGFLIAEAGGRVVRKVSSAGVITRVAGTIGVTGSSGDDGPATDAQLNTPTGVAILPDGGFLVVDSGNQVVRRVRADGVITRVAGTVGVTGSAGDDGAATSATLFVPATVAVPTDGGFLVSDFNNNVVRRVRADGVITRVAGTIGVAGGAGDDGPATRATLHFPIGLAVTPDGGFLIADQGNHVIRRVS